MKQLKILIIFFFISINCIAQSNDDLFASYYQILKKGAEEYLDTLNKFKINKVILAINIVEIDTNTQNLSFAVTDFILNNEFNYLAPSFYFKIADHFVLIKKNINGDLLQKKLNLLKVNKEIIKEFEENLTLRNADQYIHEPFAIKFLFSNDSLKSLFFSKEFGLPWQYKILH